MDATLGPGPHGGIAAPMGRGGRAEGPPGSRARSGGELAITVLEPPHAERGAAFANGDMIVETAMGRHDGRKRDFPDPASATDRLVSRDRIFVVIPEACTVAVAVRVAASSWHWQAGGRERLSHFPSARSSRSISRSVEQGVVRIRRPPSGLHQTSSRAADQIFRHRRRSPLPLRKSDRGTCS